MKSLSFALVISLATCIPSTAFSKGFSSGGRSFSSSRSVSITKSSPPKKITLTKTQPVEKPKSSYTKPVIVGTTVAGLVGTAAVVHGSSTSSTNTVLPSVSTTTNKVTFVVKDKVECLNIRDKQIIISGEVRILCKINGTENYIR
jgi:uncharacterized Zn-binding protein involved in type VI secretion